jgi:hypothetical protein
MRQSSERGEIRAERVGHEKNGSEKNNVRKEIRFRGGARSLFCYHARLERRTSVCKRFRRYKHHKDETKSSERGGKRRPAL